MNRELKIYLQNMMEKLLKGDHLSYNEAKNFFEHLLLKEFKEKNDAVLGAFLAILRYRKPTMEELQAMADVLYSYAWKKQYAIKDRMLYEKTVTVIGSGRDAIKTFNISTAAGLVAAAAGAYVAKPGSRSETGVTGTTDIMELLGINVNTPFEISEEILKSIRFAFFNSELALPEIFNFYIGKVPFFNPLEYILSIFNGIKTRRILIGISDPKVEITANFLRYFGYKRGIVLCGCIDIMCKYGYIDEASVSGPTIIGEVKDHDIKVYELNPKEYGIKLCSLNEVKRMLVPKDRQDSLNIFLSVLTGKDHSLRRDIVVLNAALILYISHLNLPIKVGINEAEKAIDTGKVLELIENLRAISSR